MSSREPSTDHRPGATRSPRAERDRAPLAADRRHPDRLRRHRRLPLQQGEQALRSDRERQLPERHAADSALRASSAGSSEPQREADTEVLVAHSPEVAQGVRQQLAAVGDPADELLGEVKVEAAQNANILNIIATTGIAALLGAARERVRAAVHRIQDALAAGRASRPRRASSSSSSSALPAGSPERAALQESLQRLNAPRAVAGGGANMIGAAPSHRPAHPAWASRRRS